MAYEQRDNSGTLFKNDRKTQDNHPDMSGKIMVAGVMYWISGWTKKTQTGDKFLSLSTKPIEGQSAKPKADAPKPVPVAAGSGEDESELPF